MYLNNNTVVFKHVRHLVAFEKSNVRHVCQSFIIQLHVCTHVYTRTNIFIDARRGTNTLDGTCTNWMHKHTNISPSPVVVAWLVFPNEQLPVLLGWKLPHKQKLWTRTRCQLCQFHILINCVLYVTVFMSPCAREEKTYSLLFWCHPSFYFHLFVWA